MGGAFFLTVLERISQMQRKLEIFKSKVPQLNIVYFPYITQKLEGGLKHAIPKYQEDTVDIRKDIQDILFIEGLEIVSNNELLKKNQQPPSVFTWEMRKTYLLAQGKICEEKLQGMYRVPFLMESKLFAYSLIQSIVLYMYFTH